MVTTVGILDDSIIVRSALEKIIDSDPEFRVVGKAADPFKAREMILDEDPDVLTLDVEMPKLDGLTFLERIMEHHPMPVVMVSSLTESTTRKGMKALELGAVDVVGKPSGDTRDSIQTLKEDLLPKLKAAARVSNGSGSVARAGQIEETSETTSVDITGTVNLIVIGASTGGTNVLLEIFRNLPEGLPPIMITQHMPPVFTGQFSDHLDQESEISVFEADEDGYVNRSEAVLAEGNRHLVVDGKPRGERVHYSTTDGEKVCFQRPAVDPLFESAASHGKDSVLGIVLTGMGKDGLQGSKAIAGAGGTILVQDEASCTVYGMPKQVKNNIAAAQEIPLDEIPSVLASLSER
ncbi:MAG: chemotaxis-specific protein-glutamate methyltransferase CheB [bacterium]